MNIDRDSRDRQPGEDQHLDDGLCLDLVAGLLDEEQKEAALAHAERCPDCEETLREVYGDYFVAESRLPGKRIARRRFFPVVAGMVAAAAVCLLMFWPGGPAEIPGTADIDTIRTTLGMRASQRLIFPGTELSAQPRESDYREGIGVGDGQLIEALDNLEARRRQEGITAGETYWLAAGHIARGRLSRARSLLPSRTDPAAAEARWITLAALIAFRESHLVEARDLLQKARQLEAGNPVHEFNLGLVLLEMGELESTRMHLRTVMELARKTPLGDRARALLDSLAGADI